jgi:hypothetical protein
LSWTLAAGTPLHASALRAKISPGEVMIKSTSVAVFLVVVSLGLEARAQETGGNGSAAPIPSGDAAGQPLNSDHLAPTGKTLPNPGVPQASGTTDFDRQVQKQDDKTQESICKGC